MASEKRTQEAHMYPYMRTCEQIQVYPIVVGARSILYDSWRRILKNVFMMEAHSSSHTPRRTTISGWKGWVLSAHSSDGNICIQLPSAPRRGFGAPYTKVPTRDCSMAPAHMGQGSNVTYRVQSRSLHPCVTAHACRIHFISA